MQQPLPSQREILFEQIRIGAVMRVTAVDAQTGLEAVVQGPANARASDLQRLAASKLRYLLQKTEGQNDGNR